MIKVKSALVRAEEYTVLAGNSTTAISVIMYSLLSQAHSQLALALIEASKAGLLDEGNNAKAP